MITFKIVIHEKNIYFSVKPVCPCPQAGGGRQVCGFSFKVIPVLRSSPYLSF